MEGRDEPLDVWILPATHADLRAAIDSHRRYREAFDLHETPVIEYFYQRLGKMDLLIPPLRQRPDDIPLLAQHSLVRACAERCLPPKSFAADARSAMLAYGWPGNVREVEYLMKRVAVRFAEKEIISATMLSQSMSE